MCSMFCDVMNLIRFAIIQEFQQLKDQLHEKVKENKRIKENFDTLKMANDSLNKEVCKIFYRFVGSMREASARFFCDIGDDVCVVLYFLSNKHVATCREFRDHFF